MARPPRALSPAPPLGRYGEASDLAKLYAQSLRRLLDLSRQLDRLLDPSRVARAKFTSLIVQCLNVLHIEENRLALIDRSAKLFLECRGGQRELIRQAMAKRGMQLAPAHNREVLRRHVARGIIALALSRTVAYGISTPFEVSADELAIVTQYFETSDDKTQLGPSEQSEGPRGSRTAAVSRPLAADLNLLLSEPEPDVIAIRHEFETVSCEILGRTARLSEELEKRGRKNVHRILAVLDLESRRAKLVHQSITGILRCFGGQQRLLIEAEWPRNDAATSIADPRVEKIFDRLTDQFLDMMAKSAPSKADN